MIYRFPHLCTTRHTRVIATAEGLRVMSSCPYVVGAFTADGMFQYVLDLMCFGSPN